MNELGQNNEFLIERLTQIREFHIKRMRTSFGQGVADKGSPSKTGQRSASQGQGEVKVHP